VLLWTELFWPSIGGIELFCMELVRILRKRGHEFAIITSQSGPGLPAADSFEDTPVYRFPFHPALSRKNLSEMVAINGRISAVKKSFRPEIVHLNTVQPSVFFHLKTKPASNAPSMLAVHTVLPPGLTNEGLLGVLLWDVDFVTADSTAVLDSIVRIAPETAAKGSVIPPGVVPPALRPQPLPFDPPRILCIGRLVSGKGFDRVIDAYPAVAARFPGVELVIAGDGPERDALEKRAGGKARFTGWVEPGDVAGLMNTATVVVMPSREVEAFGLVAVQAGQMGRPVIASDFGGLREVIVNGSTGILLPHPDGAALASALLRLLSHPEEARKMGEAALRRATREFTIDRCADSCERLYRRLARDRALREGGGS